MDPLYIAEFIKTIQNVFSMMLQLEVQVGEPSVKPDNTATYDISGIIGMSGDVTGSVVLSFPIDAAERIVSLFTGTPMDSNNDDFADAIGELVNMVSGNAKAGFKDRRVSISCPSVVIGKDHVIGRPKDAPCVCIPCTTDCGEFVIEVTIQDTMKGENAASGSASNAAAA